MTPLTKSPLTLREFADEINANGFFVSVSLGERVLGGDTISSGPVCHYLLTRKVPVSYGHGLEDQSVPLGFRVRGPSVFIRGHRLAVKK